MRSTILVIGGGPVGVCCAYSLARAGAAVTLIEREDAVCPAVSAAHGNCGLIAPSEAVPLAAPGVLARGMRWMLRSSSPFHVTPRLSPSLARWLWLFRASCDAAGSQSRMPSLRELHVASAALHDELGREHGGSWGYHRNGLLEICETGSGLEGLAVEVRLARRHGVDAEELAPAAVRERFPGLCCDVAGGFFFPEDAHLDPLLFTGAVAQLAADAGAEMRTGVEALAIEASPASTVRVLTTRGAMDVGQVVLAAGVWTPALVRGLGLRLPVEPAKGYSIEVTRPDDFGEVPVLLGEASTVLTPLGDMLRIGSTLELSGWDMSVRPQRVAQLQGVAARAAGPRAAGPVRRVWRGPRPLSPDGLPFVGRCPGHENVIVAAGHCMLGLSLGPITGELVAGLADGSRPSLDLEPLSPGRFG
ncbi:MAG TPA: FAD-dependent oxidoreductase [Thermoleophilia bacterium]|nr:FAD-dependent oxidoreductase [Thermoleophilia bacterium]